MKKYNRTAKTYDSLYETEQKAKYDSIIPNIRLTSTDIVLDIGCGTGFLIPLIVHETENVVGIDLSIKMLELAKERSSGFSNVNLILADVEYLPLRDNVFSKIFVFTVLQNVSNRNKVLAEIKRVGGSESIKVVTILKTGDQKKTLEDLSNSFNRVLFVKDFEELKDMVVVYI